MTHQNEYQFQFCSDDAWPFTGLRGGYDPLMAKAIGINESIILRFIYDSTSKKQESWLRGSYESWQKTLPWLSISTIKRAIKFLEDKQLIERHVDLRFGNAYRPIHSNIAKLFAEAHNEPETGCYE